MDHFRGSSLPDKIKHLATQKMRARTIRNSMILNTSSVKEANLTQKVIKYETFLSHQMINKIKTQDLKMFESEVKEVCKQQQSVESCKSEDKRFGISRFLQDIKKQTKLNLLKEKLRQKTSEDEKNCLSPRYHFALNNPEDRSASPTNSKFKYLFDLKRKRKILDKQLKLKGTIMKSSLIEMMEKMESMNFPRALQKESFKPMTSSIEEDIMPTHKLKQEKDRLATVLQKNGSIEFKPIGNVRKNMKNKRYNHFMDKRQITEMSSISRKNSDFHRKYFQLPDCRIQQKRLREELTIQPFGQGGSKNSLDSSYDKSKLMKDYVETHLQ